MSDRHSGIRRSESLLVQLRSEDPEALISYVQLHLSVVLEVSDLDELDRLCVGVKPAEKVELKRKSLLAWVRKRHRRSSSSTAGRVSS